MTVRATRDPSYEAWRDSKVPLAAAKADADHPEPLGAVGEARKLWSRKWDAAFHRHMAELTADPMALAAREMN